MRDSLRKGPRPSDSPSQTPTSSDALTKGDELPLYQEIDPMPAPSWTPTNARTEFSPKTYVQILGSATNDKFTSARVRQHQRNKFSPSLQDIVAHLKVLRAFGKLKETVVGTVETQRSIKAWQVFVTNAARRFILYLTAVKHSLGMVTNHVFDEEEIYNRDNDVFSRIATILGRQLPPLDILMVWHALSLNPKVYYDFLVRNQFCQFYNTAFPLDQIHRAIDHLTFQYNPSAELRDGYLKIISNYSKDVQDLHYDWFLYTVPMACDIECPICKKTLLEGIPYTNDTGTGFADNNFNQKRNGSCRCDFGSIITHEKLRKRQLYADLSDPKPLPFTYKYFSVLFKGAAYKAVITNRIKANFKQQIKDSILTSLPTESLESCISKATSDGEYTFAKKIVLRHYLQMNLVHLTVKGGLEIGEDLVGCVMRQERFWTKVNYNNWLYLPSIRYNMTETLVRYARFFGLLTAKENWGMLVPTIDIDLAWHTHQLSQNQYLEDCLEATQGYVIDHDDKAEEGLLDTSFEKTAKLYRDRFGEDYSICTCWYCVQIRTGAKSKLVRMISKKPKASALPFTSCGAVGLTHISLHDVIQMPQEKAKSNRYLQQRKYIGQGTLPWVADHGSLSYALFPGLYVNSPLTPIAPIDTNNDCFHVSLHPEAPVYNCAATSPMVTDMSFAAMSVGAMATGAPVNVCFVDGVDSTKFSNQSSCGGTF